ncbi:MULTISPECIES: HAMP domain-containing sensor histidine kinase [Kitasatospora]|uniref:histidine kinase n=1 Tax=Kitasatospora setae (strain ATCC 33774 / DSM 43861 / JCM 3304 / KCC A-0304 / NBRC 14216 / KM-6054) TaxID=452652 RepID=E4NIE2_KITSK|nr:MULTISPECIES: HAMP domain-containing sensor histidine kinase [Kitasatospora]BAJ31272.1 putative two-component system sensor kinase [Kitasatospora setae KM-6054]
MRRLRPRGPRTLRTRLLAGLLTLFVLICAGIGTATCEALRHFLVDRLDQQLAAAGGHYAASLEHPGQSDHDTRAQAPGTFGARLVDGGLTHAAVVGPLPPGRRGDSADTAVPLDAADLAALRALATDGRPHDLDLSALGPYRVAAVTCDDHDSLVTGLPLRPVDETMRHLLLIELVVFTAALATAAAAGALAVRFALRPLDRVVATAERVSARPLASGAVDLAERVPDDDPRTEVGRVGTALNRLLGHVADALTRRQDVEERLRAFAADASHELRNPVATVRGHAELALRHPGPVPDQVRHSLERISAESRRMGATVEDLLLLARLDAGRPLALQDTDLTRIVLDCTTDARAAAPGHRWLLDLPAEPVTVPGDPHRLAQVVTNLLANARTHTPDGTTVTLRLAPAGRLTVTDDGPGIPAGLAPHVFDRFTRGDRARSRRTGSTGLGLAIVRAVVHAHHGTVTLDSAPGRTTFTVTLGVPSG